MTEHYRDRKIAKMLKGKHLDRLFLIEKSETAQFPLLESEEAERLQGVTYDAVGEPEESDLEDSLRDVGIKPSDKRNCCNRRVY